MTPPARAVSSLLHKPSGFAPLLLSLAAFMLVAAALAGWVPVRPAETAGHPDEGAPARLFQLLILVQIPIGAVFAAKWLPRAPRPALIVLLLQVAAAGLAIGTIMWLEW